MRITFSKRIIPLSQASDREFLESLNRYLKDCWHNCLPGYSKWVEGKVNLDTKTLLIRPFMIWKNTYAPCSCYGTILEDDGNPKLLLEFKSSPYGWLIIFLAFTVFMGYQFLPKPNGGILWFVLNVLFFISFISEIYSFRKMIRRHIEFLAPFDSKNPPKWK